ncbi:MAG: ComEC/Rec2 family competence protein [Hymenobacter sp.]
MINTLSAAAFCLLVWNPYLLCDVGFQLSFLAVLSIVYLQPRIGRWPDPRNAVLDRPARPGSRRWCSAAAAPLAGLADTAWQLTALSLAAQVATFPLGLYYFHQFPLNFLLSNLIAVPISSLAVYVGVGLLLAEGAGGRCRRSALLAAGAVLDWLPRGIGWVFEKLIWLFNEYIFLVGRVLPGAVVGGVHLSQGCRRCSSSCLIGAGCVFGLAAAGLGGLVRGAAGPVRRQPGGRGAGHRAPPRVRGVQHSAPLGGGLLAGGLA